MASFSRQLLIAAGGNLPFDGQPPELTLRQAFDALRAAGLKSLRPSFIYHTPCFPVGAGPDYANAAAVAEIDADFQPQTALALLHQIESQFNRSRETRWGMRTLDLDLIGLGDMVLPDAAAQAAWRNLSPDRQRVDTPDQLILPHPRVQDRAFVLVPLADVAPDWVHPLLGLTVSEMLARLPDADRLAVRRLDA